jgi:predicted ATPase
MLVEQPSGTVTLVFTDIEGSTRLLQELGQDAYLDALAEHRRIVRDAFSRHSGYEVDYEGDSFFYAFSSVTGAVAAVEEAMRELGSGPIRIRVGIHTGEPGLDPPKYVGLDVHRAARIMAAGYGGQVLLSQATRELIGVEASDLGEHRLKDFAEPVSIFQLGSARFPPLKTISNTNLPRPASSFVGRAKEIEEVLSLLRGGARLLTLTGPGGSGKTRLALEAAGELVPEFRSGVFWVGLASLRDPALVGATIAQTLGAKNGLVEHIGERELLLLLDNLESLVVAAPELSALVEGCPNLRLLVTSRELLRVRGEVEYSVLPLAEPDAVALFCARSRLEPGKEIAEVCRRLDTLPLALELAAARASVLSPRQILERLSERLDLLKGGRDADPRQRTLRATIDWSYELLSEEEKTIFARLAVFAGGWTFEAAEQVADADLDTLQSLVGKSLLRHSEERFWMLETLHDYAAERLENAGEAQQVERRHADYFLALAEAAQPMLLSSDQAVWLERLDLEHDNLREAVTRLGQSGDSVLELRLVGALWRFWHLRGHLDEGRTRVEAALASNNHQPAALREKALYGAAVLAHRLGDYERAQAHAEECLTLCRAVGDPERIAAALLALGLMVATRGDGARATAAYLESEELARQGGHLEILAMVVANLGVLASAAGDHEQAQIRFEEALALQRELGDVHGIGINLSNLTGIALRQGRTAHAEALTREALELAQTLADTEVIIGCLENFAEIAAARGKGDRAATLLGAIDVIREETGFALQPFARDEHERRLLAVYDEESFAAARAQGRVMTVEQAVAFALSS